ncbi:Rha family transcriptional regulator [Neorhizobium galegae]|uniref:Rha family transcriptional regulator n=1 Tax=Neorhizobium galegae TaxID=399 RepID=UPI002106B8BC|nr:Rha family transcriptional regulator [Neorhizobium galegae]MCQ1855878.1 Rha family transcriptional regulator [Neorhizobium galegae]
MQSLSQPSSTVSTVETIDGGSSYGTPPLILRGGEVVADSRDVAKYFVKDQSNVLRDVDNLMKHIENSKLNSHVP